MDIMLCMKNNWKLFVAWSRFSLATLRFQNLGQSKYSLAYSQIKFLKIILTTAGKFEKWRSLNRLTHSLGFGRTKFIHQLWKSQMNYSFYNLREPHCAVSSRYFCTSLVHQLSYWHTLQYIWQLHFCFRSVFSLVFLNYWRHKGIRRAQWGGIEILKYCDKKFKQKKDKLNKDFGNNRTAPGIKPRFWDVL